MVLSGRQKISLWVSLGYVVVWLFDPFITIFRLNVENWAAENKVDRLLVDGAPELSERAMSYFEQISVVGVGGVADAIGFAASPAGLAFVAGGLFIGFAPYLARVSGYVAGHYKRPWAWPKTKPAPVRVSPKSAGQTGKAKGPKNDSSQDQALIPVGISLSGEHHQDGLDITPVIAIRNRGLSLLRVRIKTWDCEIAGVKPENKGGVGCSGDMKPSTSQHIRLTKVRLFNPTDSMEGSVQATFILRLEPNQIKYAMTARYAFVISGIPTAKGKFQIPDLMTKIETLFYKAVTDD